MRKLVVKEASLRPHKPDFSAASADDWSRLETSNCMFCLSASKEQRDLKHVAVMDWNKPLQGSNLQACCPLCWSTRNGMSVSQLRAQASKICEWRKHRSEAFEKLSDSTATPLRMANVVQYRSDRREQKNCGAKSSIPQKLYNQMLSSHCWYCGDPPTGIDRLNSAKCPGYSAKNVVPSCQRCNSMKHVLPRGVFLRHMDHLSSVKVPI